MYFCNTLWKTISVDSFLTQNITQKKWNEIFLVKEQTHEVPDFVPKPRCEPGTGTFQTVISFELDKKHITNKTSQDRGD